MKITNHLRKAVSLLLAGLTALTITAPALAAQSGAYSDPAESWISSENRTNELDSNAVVTHETFYCSTCGKQTAFTVYRVPEYTKSGVTARNHDVEYSDGTCYDGISHGNLDAGTPGVDASYTGYHWCKAVCETCGTCNANENGYAVGKNVYSIYNCAAEFQEPFSRESYALCDAATHTVTTVSGRYCKFCHGTYATTATKTEAHDFAVTVDPQLGNRRFVVTSTCRDCGFSKTETLAAKCVVAPYRGVVNGQPHSVTLTNLSDKGVTVSVLYGTSADKCELTSAPNYTDEGSRAVYYAVTYTCGGQSMTENGCTDVTLLPADGKSENTACTHSYTKLETVAPTCTALGYDRNLCSECGDVMLNNYVAPLGHDYKTLVIREATCAQTGLTLHTCTRCGDAYTETTPKLAHDYETRVVAPTCTELGYTLHVCKNCGESFKTDYTPSLGGHDYKTVTVKEPNCTAGGIVLKTCTRCGASVHEETPAIGHDYKTSVIAPKCTELGYTLHKCVRCGDSYKTDYVAAAGHKPGDWIVDKAPTATETGSKHRVCTVCGQTLDTVVIPATGETAVKIDHPAYVVGYPDGGFHPEANMTRAEAATIFARLLAADRGDVLTGSPAFNDVKTGDWYASYINYAAKCGLVTGDNGAFRPNDPVTRAEFVVMAVRFCKAAGSASAQNVTARLFSNADSGWAASYIRSAAACGWLAGYPDGSFRPGQSITRAEAMKIVNAVLGRSADKTASYVRFTDMTTSHWAYYEVAEASTAHTGTVTDGVEKWGK